MFHKYDELCNIVRKKIPIKIKNIFKIIQILVHMLFYDDRFDSNPNRKEIILSILNLYFVKEENASLINHENKMIITTYHQVICDMIDHTRTQINQTKKNKERTSCIIS
jgi:hypothetical protein